VCARTFAKTHRHRHRHRKRCICIRCICIILTFIHARTKDASLHAIIHLHPITRSTEDTSSPKSTKSRNSNSLVRTQMKPNSQFDFVPRDTGESDFLNLVDYGDEVFSVEFVTMKHPNGYTHLYAHINVHTHECTFVFVCTRMYECRYIRYRKHHTIIHSCMHEAAQHLNEKKKIVYEPFVLCKDMYIYYIHIMGEPQV